MTSRQICRDPGTANGFLSAITVAVMILAAVLVLPVSAQPAPGTGSTVPADVCTIDSRTCGEIASSGASASDISTNGTFCIYYFYGNGCPHCANIRPFIDEMAAKYPRVKLRTYEVYSNSSNRELFRDFLARYAVKTDGIPAVFIGPEAFVGEDTIRNNLEAEILSAESHEPICPATYPAQVGTPQEISPGQNVDLTVPAVIAAALADSINPCAFAVLIFLLTSLVTIRERRRVLVTGAVYIAAVFLTYFLSGLGLFVVIQQTGIAGTVATIAAVIAIIAGIVNIIDAVRGTAAPTLAIPASQKDRINRYVREATLPAAFILGILVSVVELPCTGGVYLAILGLLGSSMTMTAGLPYLLLYNIIFVAPLIAILIGVYAGVSTETLERFRGRSRRWVRGAIGVFLIGLGLLMISGVS